MFYFKRPNLKVLSSLIYWAYFNRTALPYKLNCFKEAISLRSVLSFWHCMSVEEVLIYAHTAGCLPHYNWASFSFSSMNRAEPWWEERERQKPYIATAQGVPWQRINKHTTVQAWIQVQESCNSELGGSMGSLPRNTTYTIG